MIVRAAAAMLFILSCFGAGWYSHKHFAEAPFNNYLYYSMTCGQMDVGIRNDGTAEFGPNYDRATEAKKLLGAVHQMLRRGDAPICHETGYSPIDKNGVREVPGGVMVPRSRFDFRS